MVEPNYIGMKVVKLSSLQLQQLREQLVDLSYLHRARVENHIRRRLEMLGVHVVDHNNPYDAGACRTADPTSQPHLDFEIILYPSELPLQPLVLVRRIGTPTSPSDPGRWLLVHDGDAVESMVTDWALKHMGELPFAVIRWAGLRELTMTMRALVYGDF
jgi:hypothetical protein